ncbi:phage tail tape measure protein, partial [Glaesserella parasuis]|nr:phage tail tape measure protein [Glaesserella parasuis]
MLISHEDFLKRKNQLEEQYRSKTILEDLSNYSAGLQNLGGAFGQMADLAAQSMGKQSGIYKTMFAMSKAFAVADSMVRLQQAIVQAMGDGTAMTPAQKFANMAAVASAGMGVISQLTSISLSGMAHSGIDSIPKEGTWLLDRGERVVDSRTNQDLKAFLANQGNRNQASGKSSVNV